MSNRNFSACQQRPSAQTGPQAQHCRAGLPSRDAPTLRPCLRRSQCALHQRYLADLDLPEGLLPGVRVLVRPWVEGCACHYFTPSV